MDASGHETVLHRFQGGSDGALPHASLVRDGDGNLYGTTLYGGTSSTSCLTGQCGVVFKLDSAGNETILYSFTGGSDGGNPYAGLLRDSAGNLYGVTQYGGTGNGNGTVFELTK